MQFQVVCVSFIGHYQFGALWNLWWNSWKFSSKPYEMLRSLWINVSSHSCNTLLRLCLHYLSMVLTTCDLYWQVLTPRWDIRWRTAWRCLCDTSIHILSQQESEDGTSRWITKVLASWHVVQCHAMPVLYLEFPIWKTQIAHSSAEDAFIEKIATLYSRFLSPMFCNGFLLYL